MKKQYGKYEFAAKRTREKSNNGWVILAFLLMIGISGILLYQHRAAVTATVTDGQFISGIKAWFAKHHQHLRQEITKVKQVTAENNEEAPPIHFEFYKTLPSAQVPTPEKTVEKTEKPVAAKKATSSNSFKKVEIADAEQLARELSAAVQQSQHDRSENHE